MCFTIYSSPFKIWPFPELDSFGITSHLTQWNLLLAWERGIEKFLANHTFSSSVSILYKSVSCVSSLKLESKERERSPCWDLYYEQMIRRNKVREIGFWNMSHFLCGNIKCQTLGRLVMCSMLYVVILCIHTTSKVKWDVSIR